MMLFQQNGLFDGLDKMKVNWIKTIKRTGSEYRHHEILCTLSRVGVFNLDRKRSVMFVKQTKKNPNIKQLFVHIPVETFVFATNFGWSASALQYYKPRSKVRPVKHCVDSRISCADSGGGPPNVQQGHLLCLSYAIPSPDWTIEDVHRHTRILKEMIEIDIEAIKYNTNLLMDDVREWMGSNLREIVETIDDERLTVQTDPVEVLVSALATDMGAVRAKSWVVGK